MTDSETLRWLSSKNAPQNSGCRATSARTRTAGTRNTRASVAAATDTSREVRASTADSPIQYPGSARWMVTGSSLTSGKVISSAPSPSP